MNPGYGAFGKNLKRLRLERGLTQEKLGELVQRDMRLISSMENGRSNPRYDTIFRLCRALKVKSDELLPF